MATAVPAICFYALDGDFETLLQRLNDDEEVAFILRKSTGEWHATRTARRIDDGDTWLWHTMAGPLHAFSRPRELGDVMRRGAEIAFPWEGWRARELPCEQGPETFQLIVHRDAWPDDRIPLASLQWIGDRSALLGKRAAPETHRLWKRMHRWFATTGTGISRIGAHDSKPPRGLLAYALPVAYGAIVQGRRYAVQ
jgi:hypothetical protein